MKVRSSVKPICEKCKEEYVPSPAIIKRSKLLYQAYGAKEQSLNICHAELNAILNSHNGSVKGATVYTTLFPCNECAKAIIQSGIKKVIYLIFL